METTIDKTIDINYEQVEQDLECLQKKITEALFTMKRTIRKKYKTTTKKPKNLPEDIIEDLFQFAYDITFAIKEIEHTSGYLDKLSVQLYGYSDLVNEINDFEE